MEEGLRVLFFGALLGEAKAKVPRLSPASGICALLSAAIRTMLCSLGNTVALKHNRGEQMCRYCFCSENGRYSSTYVPLVVKSAFCVACWEDRKAR